MGGAYPSTERDHPRGYEARHHVEASLAYCAVANRLLPPRVRNFCAGYYSPGAEKSCGSSRRHCRDTSADGTRFLISKSRSEGVSDTTLKRHARPGNPETGCRGAAIHEAVHRT